MRLAEILREASPWAVLGIVVIAIVYRIITHRERLKSRSELGDLRDMLSRVSTFAAGTSHTCEETRDMLATYKGSQEEQTVILGKIAQELINLNASLSGNTITVENSKLIISYQWSWCRDETIRLLVNSIDNNHFQGNEDLIARRIFRAWKQAAQGAKESIAKFRGLQYPYEPLFDSQVATAWKKAWEWAIPLYHGDFQDRVAAIEDLKGRTRVVFDDILRAYYQVVEDIDEGTLYADKNQPPPLPGEEISRSKLERLMGRQLRNYKSGESDDGSGGYDALETQKEVQARHRRQTGSQPLPPNGGE